MKNLIIVEGLDNTGKTTLINRMVNVLETLGNKCLIIHSEKPPKNINNPNEYQHNYYVELLNKLKLLSEQNYYDYIFLDRGWMSEYVYGQIYRGRNKLEITEDNIVFDIKCQQYFKVFLITLFAFADFLIHNDDNKSLSNNNKNLIIKEISYFSTAYDQSLIKYKLKYDVGLVNDKHIYSYKDVLPNIISFIIENKE